MLQIWDLKCPNLSEQMCDIAWLHECWDYPYQDCFVVKSCGDFCPNVHCYPLFVNKRPEYHNIFRTPDVIEKN